MKIAFIFSNVMLIMGIGFVCSFYPFSKRMVHLLTKQFLSKSNGFTFAIGQNVINITAAQTPLKKDKFTYISEHDLFIGVDMRPELGINKTTGRFTALSENDIKTINAQHDYTIINAIYKKHLLNYLLDNSTSILTKIQNINKYSILDSSLEKLTIGNLKKIGPNLYEGINCEFDDNSKNNNDLNHYSSSEALGQQMRNEVNDIFDMNTD